MDSFNEQFETILKDSDTVLGKLGKLPSINENNYNILIKDYPNNEVYYSFGDFSFLPSDVRIHFQSIFLLIGAYKYGIDVFNNPRWYFNVFSYFYTDFTRPFDPQDVYAYYKIIGDIKNLGWFNWCERIKRFLWLI